MRFGLDFGTSNSTIAVSDGDRVQVLPVDALAGATMPTVLYVRRDGSTLVGRPAIDAYLADNRARGPIRRQVKMLGIRVASSDPEQPTVEAHILTDADAPGRFFQSLKSFLGSPLEGPTSVFGTAMSLQALIAIVLGHVRERAGELTGTRPDEIAIGRPVEFVGGPGAERLALSRLEQAAHLAGFRKVHFQQEPVAAAHAADVREGISLIFDFGGGTLDLAIARREADRIEIVATAGRAVGGDRLTGALIDDVVAPLLGTTVEWSEKRLRLPAFIANAIHDWHALSALNEKPLLDALDDLARAGAPRREIRALRSAIELQLGYEIFAAADETKCELSELDRSLFSFHRGAVDVDTLVPRRRFELRIAPLLREIEGLLEEVLERAHIRAGAVGEVVLTGGSSALPAARALLSRRFPDAARRDFAAYSGVASGLALGAPVAAPIAR